MNSRDRAKARERVRRLVATARSAQRDECEAIAIEAICASLDLLADVSEAEDAELANLMGSRS